MERTSSFLNSQFCPTSPVELFSSPISPNDRCPGTIKWMLSRAVRAAKAVAAGTSLTRSAAYQRVMIDGDEGDGDFASCAELLARVILLRKKYKDIDKGGEEIHLGEFTDPQVEDLEFKNGIFYFKGLQTKNVGVDEYLKDIELVYTAVENGPCLSVTRGRLKTLEQKFELYSLLNTDVEEEADKLRSGGGVFANCTKVDNNVSLRKCMDAATFVEYVISVCKNNPDVLFMVDPIDCTKTLTLGEVLKRFELHSPSKITAEGLGLHPQLLRKQYTTFDAFDPKLNPAGIFGATILRGFLSKNTPSRGILYSNLVRPLLEEQEIARNHIVASTSHVQLCGSHLGELEELALWLRDNRFINYSRNMWVLEINRTVCCKTESADGVDIPNASLSLGNLKTHGEQIYNIFYPMFMATLFPEDPVWSTIATFLKRVSGISAHSNEVSRGTNLMFDSKSPENIPFSVIFNDYRFYYYAWANVCNLNALRCRLGVNVLQFIATCSDNVTHLDQLVCSYLLADHIRKASKLQHCWLLQYLYMFHRIGVVMCPLADNTNSSYFDHPFPLFFKRGLNVCLSTSDRLYFHHNTSALIEEYGTAMKIFRLTAMDMCEIARNSCLISNFPHETKSRWLGSQYMDDPFAWNDPTKTNLSDYRLQFRHECLSYEQSVLNLNLVGRGNKEKESMMATIIPVRRKCSSVMMAMAVDRMENEKISNINNINNTQSNNNIDDIIDKNMGHNSTIINAADLSALRNIRRINYMDARIKYPRIDIFGATSSSEQFKSAAQAIREVINVRNAYITNTVSDVTVEDVFKQNKKFDESIWEYNSYYGVFLLTRIGHPPAWPQNLPTVSQYIQDVNLIRQIVVGNSDVVRMAAHRLSLLEHKFKLHLNMNMANESGDMKEKELNNRDFYTAHKVDNHIHTDAGMNARTLLDFFSDKANNSGSDVVFEEKGNPVTLKQLLDRLYITPTQIAIDELHSLIQNNEQIREIFLSTDNYMQGRYFAELTKKTLELYKEDAYTFSENRLNLYGKSDQEWYNLAMWFDRHGMASRQNKWMVNLGRSYRKLRREGAVKNFAQFLDNIFQPLFEVSLHPADMPKFHYFLTHVSGFDCVDDESKVDMPLTAIYPHNWTSDFNPPYNYYNYYYWANIVSLNEFRASRGLSTFTFRPQCGELGGIDHLISGFLLANSINQGVTLRHYPAMEYIYYILQIGIAMSPLSNTLNSIRYIDNPFPLFFSRGLKVSLSTVRPLFTHFTREPLIEEYSIASKLWSMQFNDLCEVARNSVIISGFNPAWKAHALGQCYYLHSTLGNDVERSRVSDIRIAYRFEVYHTELNFLDELLADTGSTVQRAMKLLEQEIDCYEKVTGNSIELPGDDFQSIMSAPPSPLSLQSPGAGKTITDTSKNMNTCKDITSSTSPTHSTKTPALPGVIKRLRSEVEFLEKELLKTKVLVQQVNNENETIAEHSQRIRRKLKEDPLIIKASLLGGGYIGPWEEVEVEPTGKKREVVVKEKENEKRKVGEN